MKHVHCADCENKIRHESFRPNEVACSAAFLPISASASMTILDAMSLTRKNLHLSRMCESFKPSIPWVTAEIGAIV